MSQTRETEPWMYRKADLEHIEIKPELQPPRPTRGISPSLLLEQVRNTIPFLFDASTLKLDEPHQRHLALLRTAITNAQIDAQLNHVPYFELCLCAHHATVASFVPTDVDHQIRSKLWDPALPDRALIQMTDLVIESYEWDETAVSTRWIRSPISGAILSGHKGEWFSTAAAAYGALRRRAPERAAQVAGLIVRELQHEAQVFMDFKKARDGIGLLKASTIIAHNLGDLDRVIEAWNIPDEDALKEAAYKAGHENETRFQGALVQAGNLNKTHMAHENHRHFALRVPRPLRRSPDFLLPIGPFYDGWGSKIGHHPGLRPEEIGEIVEALVEGWEKLSKNEPAPVGYARALAGILETFPGGFHELTHYLPARVSRTLKAGPLRTLIAIPRKRFEEQWSKIPKWCS